MNRLYLEFMTSTEACKDAGRPTCGRWMLHLHHCRSYFNLAMGTTLTVQHTYQQELRGFSRDDFQNFFDKDKYARGSLPRDQHLDEWKLGHLLFLKLKTCKHFEHEIRRYKRAKICSQRRKFSTLWKRVEEWLLEQDHAENAKAVDAALTRGPAGADQTTHPRLAKQQRKAKAAAAKAAAAPAPRAISNLQTQTANGRKRRQRQLLRRRRRKKPTLPRQVPQVRPKGKGRTSQSTPWTRRR